MKEKFDVLNELGEFTGKVANRDECHEKGLWHRGVYAFVINGDKILLQKRSKNKKLWPDKWDVTIGGHVDAGEFGIQTIIRECKEELGIDITDDEVKYVVTTTSVYNKNGYINNHYDECFLITKNIDVSNVKLQKEEVSEVKYFSINDILDRISNNYDGLTEKNVAWGILKKILESDLLKQLTKSKEK